ncbi:hypothetical protein WJX72_003848 [[Myrmecia] bisecta]|uniref:GTP diphosphokinase n=1 Tax=[Myrmecia] bisecta TaxID=41462 RepID=A0AAW1Q8X1_9CHLO
MALNVSRAAAEPAQVGVPLTDCPAIRALGVKESVTSHPANCPTSQNGAASSQGGVTEEERSVTASLPGSLASTNLVEFVTAWEQLALRLPPHAGLARSGFILNALKLAVAHRPAQRLGQADPPASRALAVASRLADLSAQGLPMDAESIAAGILADAVQLGSLSVAVVEQRLGPIVAHLLHDLIRVRTLPARVDLYDDTAASALRELCLSFYDVRAIVVEVVARLDSLCAAPPDTPRYLRQLAALEALQIYAPMGHALGMGRLAVEMEDRCFQDLFPRSYQETSSWLRQEMTVHEDTLERCQAHLLAAVHANPDFMSMAAGCEVLARTKSLFSTMKKLLRLGAMAKGGRKREEVYDLLGMRVIVKPRTDLPMEQAEAEAEKACYIVEKVAHSLWQQHEGRYKDYIREPKENGYQSLHTTVRVPSVTVEVHPNAADGYTLDNGLGSGSGSADGAVSVELQIRTQSMHELAESGEAAHAAYKGGLDAGQARRLQTWTESLQQSLQQMAAAPGWQAEGGRTASRLWQDAEAAAEELFRHLDKNGDGFISHQEMQQVLAELGVQSDASNAAAQLMAFVNTQEDGDVSFPDFLQFHKRAGVLQALPHVDEETVDSLRQSLTVDAAYGNDSQPINSAWASPVGQEQDNSLQQPDGDTSRTGQRGVQRSWVRRGNSTADSLVASREQNTQENSKSASAKDQSHDDVSGSNKNSRRIGRSSQRHSAAGSAAEPRAKSGRRASSQLGRVTLDLGDAPVDLDLPGVADSFDDLLLLSSLASTAGAGAAASGLSSDGEDWKRAPGPGEVRVDTWDLVPSESGMVLRMPNGRPYPTNRIPVPLMGPLVIGGSAARDCDVVVDDASVSGRHVRLEMVRLDWRGHKIRCLVTDLDSTNGTWLNRGRLRKYADAHARAGDLVRDNAGDGRLWLQLAQCQHHAARAHAQRSGYAIARAYFRAAMELLERASSGQEQPRVFFPTNFQLRDARAAQAYVGALRRWGRMEAELRHDTSARRLWRKAVDIAKQHPDGLEAAGGLHTLAAWAHKELDQRNLWKAARMCDEALRASPNNARLLKLRGRIEAAADRCDEARVWFSRSRAQNSGDVALLLSWARMEAETGHMERARQLFADALTLDPCNAVLMQAWAHAESGCGNFAAARSLFKRSLFEAGDAKQTWHAWAVMEARVGEEAVARSLFRRVLQLDPANTRALAALAALERGAGRLGEARRYAEQGLSWEPFNPGLVQELAWALEAEGQYAAAGRLLTKADSMRARLRLASGSKPANMFRRRLS